MKTFKFQTEKLTMKGILTKFSFETWNFIYKLLELYFFRFYLQASSCLSHGVNKTYTVPTFFFRTVIYIPLDFRY